MSDYACWFCKETIEEDDVRAVNIKIENLWLKQAPQPSQEFFAHSECAKIHLSFGYSFDPDDHVETQ